MIDKRFTYVVDNGEDTIYDLSSTGVVLENFMDIEEMLNSLYVENEQLKSDLMYWRTLAQSLMKKNNVGGF